MSTTIDTKVVEMRFDNKHFESNVKDTMSTLEKLKQKLNLTGASKGLENIKISADKVNMNGLGNALDTVHSKFSALEVMGVTALANITNSAVNAGKRMVSALTIDPVTTGFKEYETQINAVQTILANTQKEGTDIKKVNAALDELNAYADQTIYNFTEMTKNIGTFTAAGVKLDTSVNAIKGIANLAAVSGSTSQQASTAMYQLSQALSSGTVKLMDWNSVVNAGMGGQVFQDALKDTARVHGIAIDKMIKSEGSFRETLQKGWLTSEILTETLEKFTYNVKEGTKEWDELKESLKKKGYTEEQAKAILKLGNTATDAATKVKTFTQLWDVLKEAAQSGWAQTWRLIVGDFEEAKSIFTPLATFLTNVINGFSEARNKLLESAFAKNFKAVFDNVKKSVDGVKGAVEAVKDYAYIVNQIIAGKWGNGQSRWDKLTQAGYDWAHAQNKVNEKLGNSKRHATDYKEAQDELAKGQEKVSESTTDLIIDLIKLSDAELKAKGFTDEQIKSFRELEDASKKTGIPLKELIENIDQIDGRYLLINSFKNVGQGLVAVFKAMKDAWREIFPPMSGDTLFNIIAGIHRFSTYLTVSEEAADKFKRTLKGAFAILDMALTIIGGPIKIVFKAGISLLEQLFKALNIGADGILGITASVGDAIVGFRDWLDSILDFSAIFEFLVPYLIQGAKAIGDWFKNIGNTETIKNLTKYLLNAKDAVVAWFTGLKEIDNIPQYIIQGLANGLKNGAKVAIDAIIAVGKGLIDGIKKILDSHSPSMKFYEIGKDVILGLINGIKEFAGMAYSLVMSVGSKLIDIVRNLDIGSIFTILLGSGMAFSFIKIAQAIDRLTSPFEGLDHLLTEAGDTLKVFQGTLKSFSLKVKADAIKTIAEAIAILAGSVAVLALLDQGKVWSAVGAIAALASIMGILTFVIGKFGGTGGLLESLSLGKIVLALMGLSAAMLIMSKVVNTLGGMSWDEMGKAGAGITVFTGIIVGLIAATKLVTDKDISQLGKVLFGISGAMLLLAITGKLIAGMTWDEMGKAGVGLLALGGLITGLIAATKLITNKDVVKIGSLISSVGWAMLLLAVTCKIIAGMTWDEMGKAGVGILAFSGIIVGLIAATKLVTGKDITKLGTTILGVSGAILMLAFAARIIEGMEWSGMLKAGVGIAALGGIVTGLIAATKLVSGKDLAKVGTTIILLSGAITLLAVSAALLSLMSWEGLAKGVMAVGFLSLMVAGLVKATQSVPQNIMGTMIAITVAIGIMSIALATLSLIDTQKLLGASVALGIVMGMFALMVKASSNIQQGLGTLIVLTVAIGVLAAVLVILSKIPANDLLTVTASLSMLLMSLSASMLILSKMGPSAMLGVGSIALLSLVVGGLAAMLGLLQQYDLVPSMETVKALSIMLLTMTGVLVILSGIGLLGPAAYIGIGALATLIVGMGALIAAIGALATEFPMLEEFLNKGIPIIEKIGFALGSFVGNIIGGLLDGITNGLPKIGTDLSMFMTNAMPFIMGAKMIDSATLEGIKSLAEAVLVLTAANVLDGLTSWLTGGTSFVDFGKQLAAFGPYMAQYAAAVAGIDSETVVASANAAKALSEMAANIPNTGGLAAWFAGENDMNTFGTQLVTFGSKLKEYSIAVNGINVESITASANAAKALGEMANSIPNMGGVVSWFTGDNDLATFGSKLVTFGTKLKEYATEVEGINVESISASVTAAEALSKLASSIPNMGGVVSWFTGDNDLATFGEKLVAFGQSLQDYSGKVSNINTEALSNSTSAFSKLVDMAKGMSGVDFDGLGDFSKSLNKIGSDSVDKFVNAFKDGHAKAKEAIKSLLGAITNTAENKHPDFTKVGKNLLTKITDAITENKTKAEKSIKEVCSTVIKAIKDKYEDFKSSGAYVVAGFSAGITENTFAAEAAAKAMAEAALEAAREALREASPSKAFYEIGDYGGQGFVNALNDYESIAYNSGYGMADMAKNGLSKAMTKVSDLVSNGIDTQPVIRPVLDLTDVESGAGYMSSMFNNPSVGVMSNLNAISSGMNHRNQNGTNADVVSAIDKLRKDLGNVGGNTYNINGVSADGDDSVNEAIQNLIRVIKVERRT